MSDISTPFSRSFEAALFIRDRLPAELANPRLAVICGSGLGSLQHCLLPKPAVRVTIDYEEIPHMPKPTGK